MPIATSCSVAARCSVRPQLILLCLILAASLVSQPAFATPADTADVRDHPPPNKLQTGDSASVCPTGDRTVLFLQFFRTTRSAQKAVFPLGEPRVEAIAASDFRGDVLQRLLAKRAKLPPSALTAGAATVAFFRTSIATAFLTKSGDGLAVSARSDSSTVVIAICTVDDSTEVQEAGHWRLHRDKMLLIPVQLDEEPHLLALRAATMNDSEISKEANAFRMSVVKVGARDQKVVWPGSIPSNAATCLGVPPARKAGGEQRRGAN